MGTKKSTGKSGKGTKRSEKLPGVRKSDEVVAVVCSDMHLSHKAPIARSTEPDWYEAMARTLYQLQDLCEEHDCPLIIAGDIFDKWNSPAELINFAMDMLPNKVYAVPGQHDMPYHNGSELEKSAYTTLVKANKIQDITKYDDGIELDDGFYIHGFGWGADVEPLPRWALDEPHIAIIHSYIWDNIGHSYPGADKSKHIGKWEKKIQGYHSAFFGDNHKGFYYNMVRQEEDCHIMNCGTLMRRKVDEINYEPTVGLLYRFGNFTRYKLDCSQDKFIDLEQAMSMVERGVELGDFLGELASLGEGGINFFEAVKQFLNDNGISKRIRRRVLQALEKDKK